MRAVTTGDIGAAAVTQYRVITALVFREMRTRFGAYSFGYAWAVIEPVVQILIFSAMFYLGTRRPPIGLSYETFFLTGYIPFLVYRNIASRGQAAIISNRALLAFPPVQNADTVWARVILELATALISTLVVCSLFGLAGHQVIPHDPIGFLAAVSSAMLLGTGFAFFNAVMEPVFGTWSLIIGWYFRAEFFVSGIWFLADRMPPAMRAVVEYIPIAHSIMWARSAFYAEFDSDMVSPSYPLAVGAVLLILGLFMERTLRRKVDQR